MTTTTDTTLEILKQDRKGRVCGLTPQVGRFKTEALRFISLFGFLAAKVR